MDKRVLDMYKLQDVIEDLLAAVPVKQIARTRKISKNTVKKYRAQIDGIIDLNPDLKTNKELLFNEFYRLRAEERSANFRWLEERNERISQMAGECENHLRLHEVLVEMGYKGSYSSFLRYADKCRKDQEKVIFRIETKPGEVAQVDFGNCGRIFDENTGCEVKAYVFVMVLGYSRDAYYEIVRDQKIETWCTCHIHAFEHFCGVPKIIIPDNLKSAIIKASFTDPEANRSYADLARHYGFQIDPCLPGTPQHKGKVESGVKYVKNNFLPFRSFRNFEDANRQLAQWNETTARVRIHGTTRRRPIELFERDEHKHLLPVCTDRFEITVWKHLKVNKDIHVQCEYAYYSAPYEFRGEHLWVRKTASQIVIFRENKAVCVHRKVSPGKRSTNPSHYPPDSNRYMQHDTDYCIGKAKQYGENTERIITRLLREEPIRNLRSAQNILHLGERFDRSRLERACERAVHFGNYTYHGIKNILEKHLDSETTGNTVHIAATLDASYARDLFEMTKEN